MDHHFGGSLACGIRVGWGQDAGLLQLVFAVANFAINLVCRYMDKSLDASFLGALQKDVGAIDVCVGKAVGIAKTQIHVRLSGKVHHGIDVITLHAVKNFGGIGQVAMIKGKVALVVEGSGVVESRAVIELVKRHNVVSVGVCQGEMANNPGSAGVMQMLVMCAWPFKRPTRELKGCLRV